MSTVYTKGLYNIHKDATIDSIEVIAVDTMPTTEDAMVFHWFIRARISKAVEKMETKT